MPNEWHDVIPVRPARMEPRAGFDWEHVKWDGLRDPLTKACSYCGAVFTKDEAPLRFFHRLGSCAFCDNCAEKWWGLETVAPADDVSGPVPPG